MSHGYTSGGNFWYDRSQKPPASPVVSENLDPKGSFYDVAFSDPSGDPTQHGHELAAMIRVIRESRAQTTDKVTLIGHSLGGLSARCYVQNTNLYQGDVAKLVTVGTPNLGVFPDHANYKDPQGNPLVGVKRMILDGYAKNLSRYTCGPCLPIFPGCVLDPNAPSNLPLRMFFGSRWYVKEVVKRLEENGWDFNNGAALKGDLLFTDSAFMKTWNQTPGKFAALPRNVEYWSLVGRDRGNLVNLLDNPPVFAGFMNTFLKNCPDQKRPTCDVNCSQSDGGDGFVSAWSQNLANSPTAIALGIPVHTKVMPGVNHAEESNDVGHLAEALGLQSFIATAHSPVHIEVRDPEGRTTSRYRWEIPDAFVQEEDFDGDGEDEESVTVLLPQAGDYEVKAIPKPDAPPDATYSITVEMNGEVLPMVIGRSVSEIPAEPEKVFINTRPVAVVTGPESVSIKSGELAHVQLDGFHSFDIDADTLSYRWEWEGGTSSEVSPTFDLAPGIYEFSLIVNDGLHNSEAKVFAITVKLSVSRGDANGDGERDVSDAVAILFCLFLGTRCPTDACTLDVNADGSTDISDALALLRFLFLGGPAPATCFP